MVSLLLRLFPHAHKSVANGKVAALSLQLLLLLPLLRTRSCSTEAVGNNNPRYGVKTHQAELLLVSRGVGGQDGRRIIRWGVSKADLPISKICGRWPGSPPRTRQIYPLGPPTSTPFKPA